MPRRRRGLPRFNREREAANGADSGENVTRASGKLQVLHIPSWFPTPEWPDNGVSVLDHVRACGIHNESRVLYVHRRHRKGCSPVAVHTHRRAVGNVVDIEYFFPVSLGMALLGGAHGGENGHGRARSARLRRALVAGPAELLEAALRFSLVALAGGILIARHGIPDVLHVHVFQMGPGAVLLSWMLRIPLVVSEHWSALSLGRLSRLDRLQARFVYRHAAAILPVSHSMAGAIEDLVPGRPCRIVSNAVDTSVFFHRSNVLAEPAVGTVLVVTRLVPIKSVDTILQATAILRVKRQDFRVVIAGDGPERARLEDLARRLDVHTHVQFLGLLPKSEVARWMRECSFVVVPSLWETQSVVTLEALCSGKRVVASEVGGLPELVTPGRGVLFRAGAAEELAAKLDLLLDSETGAGDPTLAAESAATFGLDSVAGQLDAVYRYVARRPRAPASVSTQGTTRATGA